MRPARRRPPRSAAAPPAAGSTVRATPFFEAFAPVTLAPSWKVMPCLPRMRWNCLATSPSMPGRMRSRNSTTVTSAPRRRQTEPSSSPMTPAPMTTQIAGHLVQFDSAPVDDTICFSSIVDAWQPRDVGAGGDDDVPGLDRRCALPSAPVTSTLPAPRTLRLAGESRSILFFFIRNATPLTLPSMPCCL